MGMHRPMVVHDIEGRCLGRRGADVVIERRQRRARDALRAATTDLTGRRSARGDAPRQGVVTLTERGPRLVSAPPRIGLGQRGLARDRHRVETAHAGALGMGAPRIQHGGERRPFAVLIRIRTAKTGAGPFQTTGSRSRMVWTPGDEPACHHGQARRLPARVERV